MKDEKQNWLDWAVELQSLAQSALYYCKDKYDIERFERIREISAEMLQMTGAVIDTAENGQEAFERFLDSPTGYYQMIFMDIQMPVMNGYDCVKAIRSSGRGDAESVPVIAMTANAFAEDVIMSAQAGMNEHLAKPIKSSQLAEILQKWVLRRS